MSDGNRFPTVADALPHHVPVFPFFRRSKCHKPPKPFPSQILFVITRYFFLGTTAAGCGMSTSQVGTTHRNGIPTVTLALPYDLPVFPFFLRSDGYKPAEPLSGQILDQFFRDIFLLKTAAGCCCASKQTTACDKSRITTITLALPNDFFILPFLSRSQCHEPAEPLSADIFCHAISSSPFIHYKELYDRCLSGFLLPLFSQTPTGLVISTDQAATSDKNRIPAVTLAFPHHKSIFALFCRSHSHKPTKPQAS